MFAGNLVKKHLHVHNTYIYRSIYNVIFKQSICELYLWRAAAHASDPTNVKHLRLSCWLSPINSRALAALIYHPFQYIKPSYIYNMCCMCVCVHNTIHSVFSVNIEQMCAIRKYSNNTDDDEHVKRTQLFSKKTDKVYGVLHRHIHAKRIDVCAACVWQSFVFFFANILKKYVLFFFFK